MLAPSGRSLNSPLRGSDNGTGLLPRTLRFSASPTGIKITNDMNAMDCRSGFFFCFFFCL